MDFMNIDGRSRKLGVGVETGTTEKKKKEKNDTDKCHLAYLWLFYY